jgi:hypothetical protein
VSGFRRMALMDFQVLKLGIREVLLEMWWSFKLFIGIFGISHGI